MPSRNIVIIHLESVSTEFLDRFPRDFPALRELRDRSTTFTNFFTTCPSSVTTFADVLHGNTSELEHIADFDGSGNRPAGYQANLMDLLAEAGYRCHGLGYPRIWRDDINGWGVFGSGEPFEWFDDHAGFDQRLDQIVSKRDPAPFAIYLWNLLSHLSYSGASKPEEVDGFSRIHLGYKALDASVARIQRLLDERGEDDTVVVAFGDHGDELWTHGPYFGFCHAFEPYTSIIRTPASVYVPGAAPSRHRSVTSVADIKATVVDLLDIQADEAPRWDSGTSMFAGSRQTASCRTLFANQLPNKALPKCYSVSNEEYSLIVGPDGMEMYNFYMDPTNHNNLLSFFDVNEDGDLSFDNRGLTHSHFRRTFNAALVKIIEDQYRTLRTALVNDIQHRMNDLGGEYVNLWDPRSLSTVRPREFSWNRSYAETHGDARDLQARVQAFLEAG